jgi:hypothetical protein
MARQHGVMEEITVLAVVHAHMKATEGVFRNVIDEGGKKVSGDEQQPGHQDGLEQIDGQRESSTQESRPDPIGQR